MRSVSLLAFGLWVLVALPVVGRAQTRSLQDLGVKFEPLPKVTIYTAKKVVTMNPKKPTAEAVAVVGKRILAVGSKEELLKAVGDQPYSLDEAFKNQVIVPGFIAQHDHPFLSSLCMTSEIIAIEDWVLPSGTVPAAHNRAEYLQRLAEAEAKIEDPDALLLTWGYHHYFHGSLPASPS